MHFSHFENIYRAYRRFLFYIAILYFIIFIKINDARIICTQIIFTTKILIRLDRLNRAGGAVFSARIELNLDLNLSLPSLIDRQGDTAVASRSTFANRQVARSAVSQVIQLKYRISILCFHEWAI